MQAFKERIDQKAFLISYRDANSVWHQVSWDGKEATVKAASSES